MNLLYKLTLFASVPLLAAALWGCKKEQSASELSPQEELQIALAAVRGEAQASFHTDDAFDNAMGISTEVGLGGTGLFGRFNQADSVPPCLQVHVDRLAPGQQFPVRITLDFGGGCAGRDGRTRSGKLVVEYSARLTDSGARALVTFENYKVDSFSISGSHEIRNVGTPAQRAWTITATDGRIERPNGSSIYWNGSRTIVQIEGRATQTIVDDAFHVTGGYRGTVRTGDLVSSWSSNIEVPLRKRFACPWFGQGTIRTVRGNLGAGSAYAGLLDYGTGTCDKSATLTLNNSTYQISLP
ncbi:hypothetical protein EPD60_12855 [Flaviaesturariibacter flavus]|uniref:Lipoprotein n=1 Tax=Flaviaesturariibacter flavus TaxID=2502780 RepID=A0A4R1B6G6_9BACT|nr:hypothetical protein [Flaviaesturariibacter flavus]TCJ13280.1 hypothetical protein EPD60_12855 [Flaviaesturariibacter flavus]